jgi:hypothetical protein
MNTELKGISVGPSISNRVEFFRLPAPGKRDLHFGLSRGWYYKASAAGEIKLVAVRQRGALRGVRLIVYDSVVDYIRRSMGATSIPKPTALTALAENSEQLTLLPANLPR